MRILITGGGGFLGQKLAKRLCEIGNVNGQPITSLTLADLHEPAAFDTPVPVNRFIADISVPADVEALFAGKPDIIFHLAAVVSGAAEADLALGLRVNLGGTMHILDGARRQGAETGVPPMVVFASSLAVHGGEAPNIIVDGVELNPQSSYGTQKAVGELLLQDYSRRGLIDGRGLRLPTVTIRPGKANAAASSFMSSIFRDTLQGGTANCPVLRDFMVWHSSPRTVVENLIHATTIPAADFGFNRNLNLPGRMDTIGAMIDAMSDVAGAEAATRITWAPDPDVQKIVAGWRAHFEPEKGLALGFQADASFQDSVRFFLADDIVNP